MKGDGQVATETIDPQEQKIAADAMNALGPSALELSVELLEKIPPKVPGFERGREKSASKNRANVRFRSAPKADQ